MTSHRPVGHPCPHQPPCPKGDGDQAVRAAWVAGHPEQGWLLLCNGVVLFDDGGAILSDGRVVARAS